MEGKKNKTQTLLHIDINYCSTVTYIIENIYLQSAFVFFSMNVNTYYTTRSHVTVSIICVTACVLYIEHS